MQNKQTIKHVDIYLYGQQGKILWDELLHRDLLSNLMSGMTSAVIDGFFFFFFTNTI